MKYICIVLGVLLLISFYTIKVFSDKNKELMQEIVLLNTEKASLKLSLDTQNKAISDLKASNESLKKDLDNKIPQIVTKYDKIYLKDGECEKYLSDVINAFNARN